MLELNMPDAREFFQKNNGGRNGEKILKVVSRSGVSTILFTLNRNPMKFSQLMFKTRLNPGILDRHLKSLMKLEIIEKSGDAYTLTQTGRRLIDVLNELFKLFQSF